MGQTVFVEISMILISCAALSWLALTLRQPLIIAYLAGGFLLGRSGLGLISDAGFLDGVSGLGITLLLFLAGLVLHPRRLKELLRQTILLTLANSAVSALVIALFCRLWGFGLRTSAFVALPLIFSSTILVLKLLPTTALHHKRMGAYCIAILIAQDIIAIALLILIGANGAAPVQWLLLPIKGILLIATALAFEQILLRRIMARCEMFHETLQLLALGWCLLIALLSHALGLSYEIGAFIAGVALARSPISYFLSEQLKPFRDFFLVFFFFVLGSRFDPAAARVVVLPALLLCVLMMAAKYGCFRFLFRKVGEPDAFAHETGARLAQASEFSLILSSYFVVARFPSPLASNPKLK